MGWCESREKVSLTDNMRACHQRFISGSLRVIRKGQIGDLTRIIGALKAHLDALNNIRLERRHCGWSSACKAFSFGSEIL